jgi:hypothetical protein
MEEEKQRQIAAEKASKSEKDEEKTSKKQAKENEEAARIMNKVADERIKEFKESEGEGTNHALGGLAKAFKGLAQQFVNDYLRSEGSSKNTTIFNTAAAGYELGKKAFSFLKGLFKKPDEPKAPDTGSGGPAISTQGGPQPSAAPETPKGPTPKGPEPRTGASADTHGLSTPTSAASNPASPSPSSQGNASMAAPEPSSPGADSTSMEAPPPAADSAENSEVQVENSEPDSPRPH